MSLVEDVRGTETATATDRAGVANSKAKMQDGITKEKLEDLYYTQRLSHRKVASHLGVKPHVVESYMKTLGIPFRSRLEATANRRTRVTRVCQRCGREFTTSQAKVRQNEGRFCSNGCKNKGLRKLEDYNCEYCGREFQALPSARIKGRGRFCSTRCQYLARLKGEYRYCPTCDKQFYAPRCRILASSSLHCSKTCQTRDKKFQHRRIRACRKHQICPTKPERLLINIIQKYSLPYCYTGDGSFWVKNFNPDFVNTNGQKKVIELFGDYWHGAGANRELDTLEGRKAALAKFGFDMLVIWEREVRRETEATLVKTISDFTGNPKSWQLGLPYILDKREKEKPQVKRPIGPAPIPMPEREELWQLYLISQFTLIQMATKYQVSTPTIRKWLVSYNIPTRSYSQSARLRIANYPETNPAYIRWGKTEAWQEARKVCKR